MVRCSPDPSPRAHEPLAQCLLPFGRQESGRRAVRRALLRPECELRLERGICRAAFRQIARSDRAWSALVAAAERDAGFALLERMRARHDGEESLLAAADATFRQAPEYVAKLHRVTRAMDALAARTASMRGRVETLQLIAGAESP